jgi:hypothetical protein
MKIVDGKARFVIYADLGKYASIEELLKPYGAVFILYINSPQGNYGHWTALIDHKDRIEFFDSYSMLPDAEFSDIDSAIRKKYNYTGYPYLTKLLYNQPKKIEYNHYRLQKMDDKIATCGRWVALRILLKDVPLELFIEAMTITDDHDKLTVILTQNILEV